MLIFQYGSNCSNAQLNGVDRLRGDAAFVATARVDDFELAFDVWSLNRGCAAADIVPKSGSSVWGALYEIPDHLITRVSANAAGRKSLDQIEGEGKNYQRRTIEVHEAGITLREAITYTVIAPKVGLQTSVAYVEIIIAGLRERGVESQYIDAVKLIASANNPEIAGQIQPL
jgi:gamma-glutamylcyclotransferase (GGCT)/AIG2-like uncharacterized protein YtfP